MTEKTVKPAAPSLHSRSGRVGNPRPMNTNLNNGSSKAHRPPKKSLLNLTVAAWSFVAATWFFFRVDPDNYGSAARNHDDCGL